MDRSEAEALLSDMLAGELPAQDLDRLLSYEEENPEFKEFRVDLETAWGMSEGKVSDDNADITSSIPAIISNVSKNISRDKKSNIIDLDTLNLLSAAGQGTAIKDIDEDTVKL